MTFEKYSKFYLLKDTFNDVDVSGNASLTEDGLLLVSITAGQITATYNLNKDSASFNISGVDESVLEFSEYFKKSIDEILLAIKEEDSQEEEVTEEDSEN